jgi:type IV pilus assembly protein PilM
LAPYIAIAAVAAVVAAGVSFYVLNQKSQLEKDKNSLESQIQEKSYIEQVIAEHDAAQAKALDAANMELTTYTTNENALTFVNELEEKIPKGIYIMSFSSTEASISIPGVASSYDDIAEFIVNLKQMDVIEDAYVAAITASTDEDAGTTVYNFSLTCTYTNPFTAVDTADSEATE